MNFADESCKIHVILGTSSDLCRVGSVAANWMVELSCSFPSPLNRTCWETAHNSYHFSHLAGTKSAVQNTSRMLFVMWRDTDLSPGPCLRLTEACPESARPEENGLGHGVQYL